MNIVSKQKAIEDIIVRHKDLIGSEAGMLQSELAIGTALKTEEAIKKIDDENRLLQIGILGRVKSGKSSLLNALLFNGKSVLPKAATPMTAALTIISYGEELSAEVEFFSHEDIENIEKGAKEYEVKFEKLKKSALTEIKYKKEEKHLKEKESLLYKAKNKVKKFIDDTELKEKAERKARREMKHNTSLLSFYVQWKMIEASNIDYKELIQYKQIKSDSLDSLNQKLLEYVGADGRYMPFTKSVHIKIPQDNLKGIQIVDTPGVNDPVQSREERTRDLLKYCDVVFIVSPSGQFVSSEDLDLMDRITSKEGIRELYVIASKIDNQLYGSVKEESGGDLLKAFEDITDTHAKHLYNTLTTLKKTNPEVGTAYDSLIEQSRKKVVHSSGICMTIKEHFDEKESWEEGVKTVWNNLTRNYPDNFSEEDKLLSIASLEMLANISTINAIVDEVKTQKTRIIQGKIEDYIDAKAKNLEKYISELILFIENKVEEIKSSNIEELKTEQMRLNNIKNNVSEIVNEEYCNDIESLKINIMNTLKKEMKSYFVDVENNIDEKEMPYKKRKEKNGLFNWFAQVLWDGGYDEIDSIQIRTGSVRRIIEKMNEDIKDSIKEKTDKLIDNWKEQVSKNTVKVLRTNVKDKDLKVHRIKKALRLAISSILSPEISYSTVLPASLKMIGVLEGDKAYEYIDAAHEYILSLRNSVNNDINTYIEDLVSKLTNINMSNEIFDNYEEELRKLQEDINNIEIVLERYSRVKKELEKAA